MAEFDEVLRVRVPARLLKELDAEAAKQMIDRSGFVRISLVNTLRAAGVGVGCWGMTRWGDLHLDPRGQS